MSTLLNPIDFVPLALDEIQGNILAGFNKDFQRFLFLSIADMTAAKHWLRHLIPHISDTTQVKLFNDAFRAFRKAHNGSEEGMPTATWLNIAFTHAGLVKLGAHGADTFPEEFRLGMAGRKNEIGDTGCSDPSLWQPPFNKPADVHIILLLASDLSADLETLGTHLLATLPAGLSLIGDQTGEDLHGKLKGHEQFGFKDGISQPGIKGFTPSVNFNPSSETGHQGVPGQDLLWPGEFVLGYPTQQPSRPRSTFDGPNPDPGADSCSGPDWTRNGSYLVFRKLSQNVSGFRASVLSAATSFGVPAEVAGAKIVGRYASGCPLQLTKDETPHNGFPAGFDPNTGDPSLTHPQLLDANHITHFEYGDDLAGQYVPRSGHIRKAYPRDEQFLTPDGAAIDPHSKLHESDTQTHRLLRRGIPFGKPFINPDTLEAPVSDDGEDRGLLFLAYQHSIADQFEFIQKQWVNDKNFPEKDDGTDPVMAQAVTGTMRCPIHHHPPTTTTLSHFVITEGGEYFFQPSISALHLLAHA